jgi:hypothetical protein
MLESRKSHPAITVMTLTAVAGVALASVSTAAQAPPSLDELLARVGKGIEELYQQAQHVICIEKSTVQPIERDRTSQGFARIVESELRVEAGGGSDAGDEATIVREVLKVNGRAPRENDKKDRAGCTDPNPLSPVPLAFLLPAHRDEYRFTFAGSGMDRNQPVFLIDFASADRRSHAELIEDPNGHDDCFDWSGEVASRGRIWVDAKTFDVVRIERGLPSMLDISVPRRIQVRHHLERFVVIDREDTTIRYKRVAFSDPDEVLLLPESIETLIITRGGLQSSRRTQTYSDYRRFVGAAKIVE